MSGPASSRISLAMLMALIGALALELAAMRIASPLAAIACFNLTLFVLLVGLVGALVHRGEGDWTGFAVFGWMIAFLSYIPTFDQATPGLLTTRLINDISTTLHPIPGPSPTPPMLNVTFLSEVGDLSNLASFRKAMRSRRNLSQAEANALDAYLDERDAYQSTVEATVEQRGRATQVGQSLFILIFAMVGAMVGKLIASNRRPTGPTATS